MQLNYIKKFIPFLLTKITKTIKLFKNETCLKEKNPQFDSKMKLKQTCFIQLMVGF